MKHYLYILECTNNNFYIGYTLDIKRRYQEHCRGTAKCKYTRSFPPKRLAACWSIEAEKGKVLSLELKLKKLPKVKKENLINNRALLSQYTECSYHDETNI